MLGTDSSREDIAANAPAASQPLALNVLAPFRRRPESQEDESWE